MIHFEIFGVETKKKLSIPDVAHDALIDKDLIHYDGTSWRFFEPNEKLIKEAINTFPGDELTDKLRIVFVDETIIIRKMIEDIEQMDADVFEGLIEFMYPVTATCQEDETVQLESTDDNLTIGEIF